MLTWSMFSQFNVLDNWLADGKWEWYDFVIRLWKMTHERTIKRENIYQRLITHLFQVYLNSVMGRKSTLIQVQNFYFF